MKFAGKVLDLFRECGKLRGKFELCDVGLISMVFQYDELKQCVREDFERFCKMGFDEDQIVPAVLEEYAHGEAFCRTESICIHLFLVWNYREKGWSTHQIVGKLRRLLAEEPYDKVRAALGTEHAKYIADFNAVADLVQQIGMGLGTQERTEKKA